MKCRKSLLFSTLVLLALGETSEADEHDSEEGSLTCQIVGEGSERRVQLELIGGGPVDDEVSVLVIGKAASGYRRLGLVPFDSSWRESAVAEVLLSELGGGNANSCTATIVSSRPRPRHVGQYFPLHEAPETPPPVMPHRDARDKLRHLGGPVVGFGLGLGLAFLGGGIGSGFDDDERRGNGPYIGPGALVGAYLGFSLGTGLGTAWVWNAGKTEGALRGAVTGSMVGGALGLGTALLTQSEASLFLVVAGPGIGAWIGAAMTHDHPDSSHESGNSLVVHSEDGLSLGVPQLQLTNQSSEIGAVASLFEGRW